MYMLMYDLSAECLFVFVSMCVSVLTERLLFVSVLIQLNLRFSQHHFQGVSGGNDTLVLSGEIQ